MNHSTSRVFWTTHWIVNKVYTHSFRPVSFPIVTIKDNTAFHDLALSQFICFIPYFASLYFLHYLPHPLSCLTPSSASLDLPHLFPSHSYSFTHPTSLFLPHFCLIHRLASLYLLHTLTCFTLRRARPLNALVFLPHLNSPHSVSSTGLTSLSALHLCLPHFISLTFSPVLPLHILSHLLISTYLIYPDSLYLL